MAHYAFLDSNNVVVSVIKGKDETDTSENWETYYGNLKGLTCKRTSYNTKAGTHKNNGVPFRKNYAGIGYTYDASRNAFLPPKEFNSWTLNEATCQWEPPTAYPEDNNFYVWNEATKQWLQQ